MKNKILMACAILTTAALMAQDTTPRSNIPTPNANKQPLVISDAQKSAVLADIGFTNAPATNVVCIFIYPNGRAVVTFKQQ